MVEASNFKLPLTLRKMGPHRIGPFKVLCMINEVAYKIKLPSKSRVHPVFHVLQLRKFSGEAPAPAEPLLLNNPGETEFEVESILDSRLLRRKRHFLIKWKGYPIEDASWEPESNLKGCPELLADFHSRRASLPGGDVMALNGLLHGLNLMCTNTAPSRLDWDVLTCSHISQFGSISTSLFFPRFCPSWNRHITIFGSKIISQFDFRIFSLFKQEVDLSLLCFFNSQLKINIFLLKLEFILIQLLY